MNEPRAYILACNKIEEEKEILYVMGVYTNKKLLLEAMTAIGIENCYIKAKIKNVAVTAGSLQTHFSDRIIIYIKKENGEETFKFKAMEVRLNKLSPIIQPKFPDVDTSFFG